MQICDTFSKALKCIHLGRGYNIYKVLQLHVPLYILCWKVDRLSLQKADLKLRFFMKKEFSHTICLVKCLVNATK